MKLVTNKYSLLVFLLFAFVIIFQNIKNTPEKILTYDVFGYYLYLPGAFIYNQLEFSDQSIVKDINDKYRLTDSLYQFTVAPNGKYLIRYPVGLAILYLPFFLLAHFLAFWYGFPMDGFSPAYHITMLACGIFYSLLGIYYLRKVLLRYFPDWKAAIILFFLIFATNYIYKAIFKGIAPHNMLFTVYAIILWFTIRWHESFRIKHMLMIALFCGIAILSRPSEIVCLIIPVFWHVTGWPSFKEKIRLFFHYYHQILIAMVVMFLVSIPQLIIWKMTTGNFLYYSYNNPAEGFDFLWPYTLKVLFSFRKGWLIYTPVMIFGIVGLYYLYRYNRPIFIPVFLFFIFNLWFVSAWSNWWYAESYGQRALVQSYAVMAIPFGYFYHGIFMQKKTWLKGLILAISLFFLLLNLFQTWQMRHGIIHASRMTGKYYFKTFGKTRIQPENAKYMLVRRHYPDGEIFSSAEGYMPERNILDIDFEKVEEKYTDHLENTIFHSPLQSLRMDSQVRFSPGLSISYKELTDKDHAWIRASVWVYPIIDISENSPLLVVTFSHDNKYYKYKAFSLKKYNENAILNQWNFMSFDYLTPEVRSKNDKLSVYLWFRGEGHAYADDLVVKVIEPTVSR